MERRSRQNGTAAGVLGHLDRLRGSPSVSSDIYRDAERDEADDFGDPLFTEVMRVCAPKGKTFPFAGIESLKGRKIGVIAGWSYGDAFGAARASGLVTAEEVSGDYLDFRKLAAGRIDAVPAIRESAAIALSDADLAAKVEALPGVFGAKPARLAYSRKAGKEDLPLRFNRAPRAVRAEGTIDKIVSSILAR